MTSRIASSSDYCVRAAWWEPSEADCLNGGKQPRRVRFALVFCLTVSGSLHSFIYFHLFIWFGSGEMERMGIKKNGWIWLCWNCSKRRGKVDTRSLDSAAGKGYHFKSVRHLCWSTGVRYFLSWISRFFTKPTWYSSLSQSHEFVNRRNFCLCLRFVFGQGHGGVFILRVYLRPTATDVGN